MVILSLSRFSRNYVEVIFPNKKNERGGDAKKKRRNKLMEKKREAKKENYVSGVCYCKKKKHVYCMTRKWHHAFIIFKREMK
jgi:hypothetical protein